MSRDAAAKMKTGIEIWDGAPGSGKSYGAVDLLLSSILAERRPVYTNLPLKLRVIRKYLKLKSKNDVTARYIHAITREHFAAFVKRNEVFSEFREGSRAMGLGDAIIEAMFVKETGPHVYNGPDANWIYPGSVLIFDEFHRWADQRMQKDEDPAFLTYATMHRHHMHRIILLTQDQMQVSLPWRRNMDRLIHCADKRKLPFLFGIPLPIPAFSYEEWPKEFADLSTRSPRDKPMSTEVKIPHLSSGVNWRFYDSFTHMGGYRRLNRKLLDVRKDIEGEHYEDDTMPRKTNPIVKITKSGLKAASIVGASTVVCWYMFGGTASASSDEPAAVEAVATQPVDPDKQAVRPRAELYNQSQRAELQRAIESEFVKARSAAAWQPYVTAVGGDYCIANGSVVHVGSDLEEWKLKGVSIDTGATLWSRLDITRSVPMGVRPAPARRGAVGADSPLGPTPPWASDDGGRAGSPVIPRPRGFESRPQADGEDQPDSRRDD